MAWKFICRNLVAKKMCPKCGSRDTAHIIWGEPKYSLENRRWHSFVKNQMGKLTKQIDIIVYRSSLPMLFEQGDFVILMPESVLGIIKVKSKTYSHSIASSRNMSAIRKAVYNGKIIGNREIFNGIFSYETEIDLNHDFTNRNFANELSQSEGYINHIAFDCNYFKRFLESGNPTYQNGTPCFSFYNLSVSNIIGNSDINGSGLAFGYFISNLLQVVYRNVLPDALTHQYFEF